jgi:hypothetical protein
MAGETNLERLLSGMRPKLRPGVFVFATLPTGRALPTSVEPVMVFREAEGLTLIVEEEQAHQAGLAAAFRCRMITLEIHSSLDAVGFLAAIARRLAAAGMGINPVSAYHHDHLFVPAERGDEALRLLQELAAESGSGLEP